MAKQQRAEDRRTRRTRQALQQAFVEVVREKGQARDSLRDREKCLIATSVQEITTRANVNRGTFYLHFTDKFMLAEAVVREQFHQQLTQVLPPEPRWEKKTLRLLILAVLHSLEEKYQHQHQTAALTLAPMIEQAIHEELTSLLLNWLKERKTRSQESPETIARVVSWAIFGTAIQWSQEETGVSAGKTAEAILQVIIEGAVQLAPEIQA